MLELICLIAELKASGYTEAMLETEVKRYVIGDDLVEKVLEAAGKREDAVFASAA